MSIHSIRACLVLGVAAILSAPSLATPEPLPTEALQGLLTRQPDHVADYTFTTGKERQTVRVALRGKLRMFALLSDSLPGGTFSYYMLRDASGTDYGVRPRDKTYAPLAGRARPFSPGFDSLCFNVIREGGTITGDVKGDDIVDGHRTTKIEMKIASGSGEWDGKLSLQTAPALRHLVVRSHRAGTARAYELSHISLDPPESLFAIPSDYTKVEAVASDPAAGAPLTPGGADDANLYGSVTVAFAPYGDGAVIPDPPLETTLILVPKGSGTKIRHTITSSDGSFGLAFRPGEYRVTELEFRCAGLSAEAVSLPAEGPAITVPKDGCVYVGNINYRYYRLPPGDMAATTPYVDKLSRKAGHPLFFLALDSGSLVPHSVGVNLTAEENASGKKGPCRVRRAEF